MTTVAVDVVRTAIGMPSLPSKIPSPSGGSVGGGSVGSGRGSPRRGGDRQQQLDNSDRAGGNGSGKPGSKPNSRPNSRPSSRSASPFFGIVMPSTPSLEKLLPNKGGNNSQQQPQGQPPALPLAGGTALIREASRSLPQPKQSSPPRNAKEKNGGQKSPRSSPSVGLCGGLAAVAAGHCEAAAGGDCNNPVDYSVTEEGTCMGNSLVIPAEALEAPIEHYAAHHDDIVTALIDEALRNGSAGNEDGGPVEMQRQLQQQQRMENRERSDSLNSDSSKQAGPPGRNKPRSPYRMKRNISRQLSNSAGVSHFNRKRQRNKDDDRSAASTANTLPKNGRRSSSGPTSQTDNNATNPGVFFHPNCVLQKEKGDKQKPKMGFGMNGSKHGANDSNNQSSAPSAVGRDETLKKLREKLSVLGEIESGKFGRAAEMLRSDAVAFALQSGSELAEMARPVVSRVETRSILTLRMGFVSMSYGILLQWDCATRLVELIVLRKMCRDDFLRPSGRRDSNNAASKRSGKETGVPPAGAGSRPPLPPKKKKRPEPIPPPEVGSSNREAEVANGGSSSNQASGAEHKHHLALPKFSMPQLPPNPLVALGHASARFLSGAGAPSKPRYFLSVSVVKVSQLHSVCDHCRNPNSVGRMLNGARLGALSKRKRKHPTIRPYIRFVLGRHEHRTKVTKFNGGNPVWTRRHHNSCLLPCPPEELRWFAGREDLVVEVRNDWRKLPGSGSGARQHNHHHQHHQRPHFFGGKSDGKSEEGDPILAAVTVPLSSVNIEDEGDGNDGNEAGPDNDGPAKGGGVWKRRTRVKDGASSTDITIPLRMNCCASAPTGSISLKITIKVPSPAEEDGAGGAGSAVPSALKEPNIEVHTSVSGGDGGPRVDESIELGPLTRLLDGWSVREAPAASKENDGGESEAAPSGNATPSTSRPKENTATRNGGGGGKKQRRLRWSRRFDHQTKKWSTLKPNANGGGSSVPSPPAAARPSKKEEQEGANGNGNNEGWFAFLNRENAAGR